MLVYNSKEIKKKKICVLCVFHFNFFFRSTLIIYWNKQNFHSWDEISAFRHAHVHTHTHTRTPSLHTLPKYHLIAWFCNSCSKSLWKFQMSCISLFNWQVINLCIIIQLVFLFRCYRHVMQTSSVFRYTWIVGCIKA